MATVALPTVLSATTSAKGNAADDAKFEPRDFDLTYTIAQYLDRHMVLPLIEFLQEKSLYPADDLWAAKLELVSRTKMVDFYVEEYSKYHGKEPAAAHLQVTPAVVNGQLRDWKAACGPLLDLLNDADLVDSLRKDNRFTLEHLKASHNVTEEHVNHLYRYAKLSFDCGCYRDAADFLYYFRILSKDEEKKFWALWGKLAAEILMVNCDAALEDLYTLRDAIDARKGDHVVQLQQRTWLIHWSLFIFFNYEGGQAAIVDFLFVDQRLLNAIQTTCPHILRYVTCSMIINKRRSKNFKDLVRVLSQEKDTYSDPLTDFLRILLVEFDFESAQKKLKQCEALLANDFFLGTSADALLESARQLVFETYARTHQCIDINLLAQRLDIKVGDAKAPAASAKDSKSAAAAAASSAAAASASSATATATNVEQKIVELIRNARVDVKIDAKKNQIVMDSSRHPSVYQQVIDKTDTLTQRTTQLATEIEKRLQQKLDAKVDRS